MLGRTELAGILVRKKEGGVEVTAMVGRVTLDCAYMPNREQKGGKKDEERGGHGGREEGAG